MMTSLVRHMLLSNHSYEPILFSVHLENGIPTRRHADSPHRSFYLVEAQLSGEGEYPTSLYCLAKSTIFLLNIPFYLNLVYSLSRNFFLTEYPPSHTSPH